MRLGVRGKLFAVSLLLMVIVGLGSGLYLEQALRGWLHNRHEAELFRYAQTARTLIEMSELDKSIASMDPVADALGQATGARVTIISAAGTVLGDSDLRTDEIAGVVNHAGRPEVQAVLSGSRAIARRYSMTLGTEMLYVAVAFQDRESRGVVRVSMPLSEVDGAVGRLRLLLALAALIGLGLSIFMSGLASQFATRAVRGLVESAHRVAKGEGSRRLPVDSADELGHLAGSFNQVVDDLDRTVTALADERDYLETILDSMSEGVLALDAHQRITRVNRAALKLLGVSRPAQATPFLEAIRVPALVELVVEGAVEPAELAEFELPGARFVQAHAAPLRTGGCVIVLRDITRTRRLEATRRDFVANVSHELRTPVSVIRANAETLADGAIHDPESALVFLEALSRNADRLSRILADLLGLSSMEAGEYELKPAVIDLRPLGTRVIAGLQGVAAAKKVSLANDLEEGIAARADAHAVEQVLANLLENAVRYSDSGGSVVLRGERAGEWVRLEVVDDGPGIPERHRARVFERFYRVDPGRSREMGGTGLGLSIVKHLVEAMGGQVGVEPRKDRGTIFWFTLPKASS